MNLTMNEPFRRRAEHVASCLPDRMREFVTRQGLFLLNWSGLRQVQAMLLQGPTGKTGQLGRLLLVGHEPWVQYLPRRFFLGEPKRELLGQVAIRALPEFLDRFQQSVDLVIARVDRLSGRRTLEGDLSRRSVGRNEASRARQSQRECAERREYSEGYDVSTQTWVRAGFFDGNDDFEMFFHSFYLPFTHGRYGDLAFVRTAQDLRRRVRRGGILWLQRGGRRVAAILFELHGSAIDLLALGTLKGDLDLVKEGAIAALYYFAIDLARTRGCKIVDFKGSRPSLGDGLLRYKSKWGVTLCDKTDSYHDLFVRWGKVNEVVKEFLSHTPLIFRDEGGLSAVYTDQLQTNDSLWIKGLHRLTS